MFKRPQHTRECLTHNKYCLAPLPLEAQVVLREVTGEPLGAWKMRKLNEIRACCYVSSAPPGSSVSEDLSFCNSCFMLLSWLETELFPYFYIIHGVLAVPSDRQYAEMIQECLRVRYSAGSTMIAGEIFCAKGTEGCVSLNGHLTTNLRRFIHLRASECVYYSKNQHMLFSGSPRTSRFSVC